MKQLEAAKGLPLDLPFEHVYGTPDDGIAAQRAEFLASLQAEVRHG